MKGWIGVDFDGTLAHYGTWVSAAHCGAPIDKMVDRVKQWLAEGHEVRIFTARIWPALYSPPGMSGRDTPSQKGVGFTAAVDRDASEAIDAVRAWCKEHIGQDLAITCVKDMAMIELYDDRCVQVRPNSGDLVGYSTRNL
jgi:hypothetical protein